MEEENILDSEEVIKFRESEPLDLPELELEPNKFEKVSW